MIIIRYKEARPLNTVLTVKSEQLQLANKLLYAKTVTIIYFEDKIQIEDYTGYSPQIYKTVGRLEREDRPFVLLIDRKCNIDFSQPYVTITQANCLEYKALKHYFPEDNKLELQDKNKLFKEIFQDYLEFDSTVSFAEAFYCFTSTLSREELITKDLVFIVIPPTEDEIYNANQSLGKFYDDGKVWYYDEEYDYDSQKTNMIVPYKDRLDEFAALYESGHHISASRIASYNEEELTKMILMYPKLFSDFATKGRSTYSRDYAYYIESNPDEFEIEDDDDEDEIEEYYEEAFNAPLNTKLCFACGNYFSPDQVDNFVINDNEVDMCIDCATPSMLHV